MGKFIIAILFLFSSVFACAQVRFKAQVLDLREHEPVPFATVKNKTQNTGGFTSDLGFFLVEAQAGDSLEIHSLGYYTKIVVLSNPYDSEKIYLEPNDQILNEVTVIASRKNVNVKKEEYGYHKSNKDLYSSFNAPIGFQVAVYIPRPC